MMTPLQELLNHLDNTLNPEQAALSAQLHIDALNMRPVPRLPVIASFPFPQESRFKPAPHGQVFDDPEKMLYNQLLSAFDSSVYLSAAIGDDLPATVRPDFGCVIIAAVFGADIEQVGDNPPWVRQTGRITYQDIINSPAPDLHCRLIEKVAARYRFYIDVLKDYPRLAKLVNIVLPDLQGPIDNLELLIGSGIFEDMYFKRDLFLEAMNTVTNAQIELTRYFSNFTTNRPDGISFQHGFPLKGGVLIRNDTSIMVSPQMYRELIAPFDSRILKTFGGGIHSCGEVNRIAREFLNVEAVECFDFGQSEMNDVAAIYQYASQKHLPLLRVAASGQQLISGDIMKQYPTGASLIFRAASFEQAKDVIARYKTACG